MASYYPTSRLTLGGALRSHRKAAGTTLEVGCGHGHALWMLANDCRGGTWHRLDISKLAVGQARRLYPAFTFQVGDIASKLPRSLARTQFDAVILNQVLWYVLARLDQTIANCERLTARNGLVIISQAFLRGTQRYGADVARGFHGALEPFCRRFPERLIEA